MEVKLRNEKREREMYDNLGELFAIIKATEKLERAYIRDIIPGPEYEIECKKLIRQYETLAADLKDTVPTIEIFADTYEMDCPAALKRLVTSGVPATLEHCQPVQSPSTISAATVFECGHIFVTAMDSLQMNMVAMDQLHPWISGLYSKLTLFPEFEGMMKMREWVSTLSRMGAGDRLKKEQARQLLYDLECLMNSFNAALSRAGYRISCATSK